MSGAVQPVADVAAALAACRERDYNEEGIEMFVALEDARGAALPAAPGPRDLALARLAAGYLDALDDEAAALEVLAANHFGVGA